MKESLSTKELIRDTLQKLLEEKDYAEISMKEIAKSANVGRRTLYRYFGTKDDIVRFMADSVMDEFADALLLQGAKGLKETTNMRRYFAVWIRVIFCTISRIIFPSTSCRLRSKQK